MRVLKMSKPLSLIVRFCISIVFTQNASVGAPAWAITQAALNFLPA
jgi:hypothetical protein